MSAPVLIAAGGTGGHVVPALAVAAVLLARGIPVDWAGTVRGLESRLVPAAGIRLHPIDVRGLRGQGLLGTVTGPLRLVRACVQCVALLRRLKPRAILGMGGFVSGPVALAALALRVPLVLHEQNAVPGMTNRRLAARARHVFCAFPGAFADRAGARVVGNPVSADMTTAPLPSADPQATLSLLVIGGSRGAQRLNELMPAALAHRQRQGTAPTLRVRHQAGAGRGAATRALYSDAQTGDAVSVDDFIDDMSAAYRQADLVVCRSGAMTVTELAARGRAALLVPYPHAVDDHQSANARWLVDAGAARLLPEHSLTAASLADEIDRLVDDRDALVRMSSAAAASFVPGAAQAVAEALIACGTDGASA